MRICTQCGAPDRETPSGETEPEHWVKPEIRWVPKGQTEGTRRRLERAGWAFRLFQGREAMERLTCVDCLRRNTDRDAVWEGMRREARRLEKGPEAAFDGYYQMLCEET